MTAAAVMLRLPLLALFLFLLPSLFVMIGLVPVLSPEAGT